ncbi:UV-damage repair protein UvrX [Fictibacillus macauensis ZFHKF-1]|uniref:UV-damage repair protein UvrX n=1 Tax=Fictibacillus macauensis ZFHKF-1 TaxID=1196324 RepID=I8J657_9BACL|nr:UV-damage repair protein uvrX [Fictibacillus macauensis]EIT87291.1 UV-damage repair protein UvrX [Fictibacillus macauensis ZFHKF-1]
MLTKQTILCIDMKSFYASCAALRLGLDPLTCHLAVVGNTERQGSVVLAASPALKKDYGIKTGSRLFEIPKDERIHVVNAQMAFFLQRSIEITGLLNRFVPQEAIHTYSVDESFIKADGTERLWGDGRALATAITTSIQEEFGLPSAIGIGPNMLLAKLCLDLEAKKTGIAQWTYEDVPRKLWPLSPLRKMWGIGPRLEQTLHRMGITKVGDLAHYPLALLEKKFGVMGNQLYHHAWGIDETQLEERPATNGQISYGKSQILLRDYTKKEEIQHVMLEMCEEVARRARTAKKAGRTISLGMGYSRHEGGGGFHRSKSIEEPTNITMELYDVCLQLMQEFYSGQTVRKLSITLSNVCDDTEMQLNLFALDEPKKRTLGYVMDEIRRKHGSTALLRAVSYTSAGTARHRSTLLGGHKA